jgi:hypothetical protein
MTEAEWLTCTDPERLLGLLEESASDRKLRLLTVASVRRAWPLLVEEVSRVGSRDRLVAYGASEVRVRFFPLRSWNEPRGPFRLMCESVAWRHAGQSNKPPALSTPNREQAWTPCSDTWR